MPKKTPVKQLKKKIVAKNTARKAAKAPVAMLDRLARFDYTEAPLPFLPHHLLHVEFARRDDALPDEGPFAHKAFAIIGELGGYTNRFGDYTEPGILIAIEGKVSRISRNDLLDALFCGAYVNRVVQDINKIKSAVEGFFAKAGAEPVDETANDGEPGAVKADDESGEADLNPPTPFTDNSAPFEA